MKMHLIALSLSLAAASIGAGQKHETKIDSMSYETGAEWKIYQTGGAVRAFALNGGVIWSITEGRRYVSNDRHREEKRHADLQRPGRYSVRRRHLHRRR